MLAAAEWCTQKLLDETPDLPAVPELLQKLIDGGLQGVTDRESSQVRQPGRASSALSRGQRITYLTQMAETDLPSQ